MVVVKGCKYVYFCFNLGVCGHWHYFEVRPRLEKSLHLLTCENLYSIYCLFSLSSLPCHLFPPVVLTCSSLSPSSILLSLSLTSPDDSRTPALAQTWPTLTWNTRCAEEEEEVMQGGRVENCPFTFNAINWKRVEWNCSCRSVVSNDEGFAWSFLHATRFVVFNIWM